MNCGSVRMELSHLGEEHSRSTRLVCCIYVGVVVQGVLSVGVLSVGVVVQDVLSIGVYHVHVLVLREACCYHMLCLAAMNCVLNQGPVCYLRSTPWYKVTVR